MKTNKMSEADFRAVLDREGLSPAGYRRRLRWQIERSTIVRAKKLKEVIVTEEETRAYYRENAERFLVGAEVRLEAIYIPFPAEGAGTDNDVRIPIAAPRAAQAARAGGTPRGAGAVAGGGTGGPAQRECVVRHPGRVEETRLDRYPPLNGPLAGAGEKTDPTPRIPGGKGSGGRNERLLPQKLMELWAGMEENRRITLTMVLGLSGSEFASGKEGEA